MKWTSFDKIATPAFRIYTKPQKPDRLRRNSWPETANALVLSSRFEGRRNALLEAMAWGIPRVYFDREWGPRDMMENEVDGLLVPPEDLRALADTFSRIMGDAKLRRRLPQASRTSTLRFSHTRVVAAWDEVIETALGEQTPRLKLDQI